MSSSQESQHSTRMFARVLGPFFVAVCITAVARASEMKSMVSDFGTNPLWPWVTGAFILAGGLIVVALHQHWRGLAAVIVSAMGWLLALRGLLLLAFPSAFMSMVNSALEAGALWRAVSVCFALLGLYLTYVGWMPVSHRPMQTQKPTRDLPRAA